jgi:hypothetical protein
MTDIKKPAERRRHYFSSCYAPTTLQSPSGGAIIVIVIYGLCGPLLLFDGDSSWNAFSVRHDEFYGKKACCPNILTPPKHAPRRWKNIRQFSLLYEHENVIHLISYRATRNSAGPPREFVARFAKISSSSTRPSKTSRDVAMAFPQ